MVELSNGCMWYAHLCSRLKTTKVKTMTKTKMKWTEDEGETHATVEWTMVVMVDDVGREVQRVRCRRVRVRVRC
jgi:hypothetical protein